MTEQLNNNIKTLDEKTFAYLKELVRTHPEAFTLNKITRDVINGNTVNLFKFNVKLPFTKADVSITFNLNAWEDQSLVQNLADKIENMILASNNNNLKNQLLDYGWFEIYWSTYSSDFGTYLRKQGLTDIKNFVDKVSASNNAYSIWGYDYILAEMNSIITTPTYCFDDYDGFVKSLDINLSYNQRLFVDKHIASHFEKTSEFTFTTSFLYRKAFSVVRVNMTQGDTFEFSAKYLDLIMPYIKPVAIINGNTNFDL